MLCGALGAGDSLLLLLGDSVKPKGRMPPPPLSPRLPACVPRSPCGSFSFAAPDKAKMERCGSAPPCLFFGVGVVVVVVLGLCSCTDAVGNVI